MRFFLLSIVFWNFIKICLDRSLFSCIHLLMYSSGLWKCKYFYFSTQKFFCVISSLIFTPLFSLVSLPQTLIWKYVIYISGEGSGTPLQYSCLENPRRSLVGCSPQGREESGTTERLPFHFSFSCIGEGNDNPLQCSCLENPRDGGAWWAAI